MSRRAPAPGEAPRRSVVVLGVTLIVVLVCAVAEGGSYLAVSYLAGAARTRTLFYEPPSISRPEYEDYLARRDPQLGWPPPEQIGGPNYDRSGSRRIPVFPEPGDECVSLYGDSFTYASDVSDEAAWSNVLSGLMQCRVANFGVGGYGTDQAFLRLERNRDDRAPVTLLGVYPTDAIRNLTRDAYFALGVYPTSFKPRFAYRGGSLELLPIPTIPAARLEEFARAPERFLEPDELLPGKPYGPVRVKFPYTLALARSALHPRVKNWLLGRPSWVDYYAPGDSSTGLEVMGGILERFTALCARRGKYCAVVLFPTPASYAYYRDSGRTGLEDLEALLAARGIDYLDLAPAFAESLRTRSFCTLVGEPGVCVGHFNAAGNALIAELVRDYLRVHAPPPAAASGS